MIQTDNSFKERPYLLPTPYFLLYLKIKTTYLVVLFEQLYQQGLELITRRKKKLTAYTYLPQKPSLDLEPNGWAALSPAVF